MRAAITANGKLKLAALLLLGPIMFGIYSLTMHWVVFPVTELKPTAIDHAFPFIDISVFVYVTMYPMPFIAFVLLRDRQDLLRFIAGIIGMTLVAGVVFFLFPTTFARPDVEDPVWLYRLIITLDKPLNCLPSLHAAYAVFPALYIEQSLPHLRRPALIRFAGWLWAVAILVSTLTTKQHAFIDIVAGSVLGGLTYLLAARPPLIHRQP